MNAVEADRSFANLLEFRSNARNVQKACKRYVDALKTLISESDALTGEMEKLAKGQECLAGRYGNYILKTLTVVNANRRVLANNLTNLSETAMTTFVDFDFQEAMDLKKRLERGGLETVALEPQFAQHVALLEQKRDTRFLRSLMSLANMHRSFFDVSWKLSGTLNNKIKELEAQLTTLDGQYPMDRPVKEGIVYKRGGERLFFVMRSGILHMLREGRDYSADSELDMMTSNVKTPQIADEEDWKDHYRFEINSAKLLRPVVVYVESAAERTEWVKVIQDAIASKLNSLSIGGEGGSVMPSMSSSSLASSAVPAQSSSPGFTVVDMNDDEATTTVGSGGADGSVSQESSMRKVDVHSCALTDDMISKIRACCGNDVCAECGAKNPEWAVINFGILICLECSGVHRSLGTHISRVRSLTLDRWIPESVLFLTLLGNTHHNEVFEETLDRAMKLKPDADRATREAFIRAKYQKKEFVRKVEADEAACNAALLKASSESDLLLGSKNAVRALASGANPNYVDPADHLSPLFHSVVAGNLLVMEILVQNGGDTEVKDGLDWSLMHYAAYFNRPRCITRLCQCRRPALPAEGTGSIKPAEVAHWNNCPEAETALNDGSTVKHDTDITIDLVLTPGDWINDKFTAPSSTKLPSADIIKKMMHVPKKLKSGKKPSSKQVLSLQLENEGDEDEGDDLMSPLATSPEGEKKHKHKKKEKKHKKKHHHDDAAGSGDAADKAQVPGTLSPSAETVSECSMPSVISPQVEVKNLPPEESSDEEGDDTESEEASRPSQSVVPQAIENPPLPQPKPETKGEEPKPEAPAQQPQQPTPAATAPPSSLAPSPAGVAAAAAAPPPSSAAPSPMQKPNFAAPSTPGSQQRAQTPPATQTWQMNQVPHLRPLNHSFGSAASAVRSVPPAQAAPKPAPPPGGVKLPPSMPAPKPAGATAPAGPAPTPVTIKPMIQKPAARQGPPGQAAPRPGVPPAQTAPKPAAPPAQTAPRPGMPPTQAAPKPAVPPAQAAPKPAVPPTQAAPKPTAPPAQAAPQPAVAPVTTSPAPAPVPATAPAPAPAPVAAAPAPTTSSPAPAPLTLPPPSAFGLSAQSSSMVWPTSPTTAAATPAAGAAATTAPQPASTDTSTFAQDFDKLLNTGATTEAQIEDFNKALQSIDDVLGSLNSITFQ